jgi:hypothetical protein
VCLVVCVLLRAAACAAEYRVNAPPYPGSREHVGFYPETCPTFYDGRSLVKAYVFAEHAAEMPQPLQPRNP